MGNLCGYSPVASHPLNNELSSFQAPMTFAQAAPSQGMFVGAPSQATIGVQSQMVGLGAPSQVYGVAAAPQAVSLIAAPQTYATAPIASQVQVSQQSLVTQPKAFNAAAVSRVTLGNAYGTQTGLFENRMLPIPKPYPEGNVQIQNIVAQEPVEFLNGAPIVGDIPFQLEGMPIKLSEAAYVSKVVFH